MARNIQIETSTHNEINKPRAVFIALTVYQIKFYYFISGHMSYHRVINSCRLHKTNTSIVWRTIRLFLFRYQNEKIVAIHCIVSVGTFQLTKINFKNIVTDYIMHVHRQISETNANLYDYGDR